MRKFEEGCYAKLTSEVTLASTRHKGWNIFDAGTVVRIVKVIYPKISRVPQLMVPTMIMIRSLSDNYEGYVPPSDLVELPPLEQLAMQCE